MKKYLLTLIIVGAILIPLSTVKADPQPSTVTSMIKTVDVPECTTTEQCNKYYKPANEFYNNSVRDLNAFNGSYRRLYDEWKNETDTTKKSEKEAQLNAMHPYLQQAIQYNEQSRTNYQELINNAEINNGSYVNASGANNNLVLLNFYDQRINGAVEAGEQAAGKPSGSFEEEGKNQADAEENICWTWTGGINPKACINNVIGWISYYILTVAAWILGFAGLILDEVIIRTIIGMRGAFEKIPAINDGWRLIRDIGNSFFIFILVFVAITTILGLNNGNTKRIVRNIIIVGLLVNFSLFFTKVLIDASNITTIYFHKAIVEDTSSSQNAGEIIAGFSGKFAKALGVTSIYNPDPSKFQTQDAKTSLITGVGGAIFIGVTAFAFLLAAVLLIIRFVVLIILLILSPIAYFGYILPGTYQYARKWWNLLASQLMFAPLFMIMMFLVLTLAQTLSLTGLGGKDGLNGALTFNAEDAKAAEHTASLSSAASGNIKPTDALGTVFNFVVIIAFMLFAIIISTTVASNTGGFVGSMVQRTRANMIGASKWLGRKGYGGAKAAARIPGNVAGAGSGLVLRNTLGRSAYNKLNSAKGEALKLQAQEGNERAKRKIAKLEARASADYGGAKKGGYKGRLEAQTARNDAKIKRKGKVSKGTRAKIQAAQAKVEEAQEQFREAAARNDTAGMATAKTAIKTAEDTLKLHKREGIEEIRKAQRTRAAKMGASRWMPGSRAKRAASAAFLENVRNKKQSKEEKVAETKEKLAGALATGNSADIKKHLDDMESADVKDLPISLLTDTRIMPHLTPEDAEAIRKSGKLKKAEDIRKIGDALIDLATGSRASTPEGIRMAKYFASNREANAFWS